MHPRPLSILFCDPFPPTDRDLRTHDTLPRWASCANAIKNYLLQSGHSVHGIPRKYSTTANEDLRTREIRWFSSTYAELGGLPLERFDVLFIFHILQQFPSEVKRILGHLGKGTLPIVGYTHGSHWDPTDAYRFQRYPGLHMTDLANLYCLDRVLVVSNYMEDTLVKNISRLSEDIAQEIKSRTRVVGLPINTELLDKCRTTDKFTNTTVIYNHSLINSKKPEMFLRVISALLKRYPITVVITRKIPEATPVFLQAQELLSRFKDRVILGNTLPVEDYYRVLWKGDIQVSTAIHETLGMSTLEAMYTRNCCILPNHASYPEITSNYEGILYRYDDHALYEKLCFFIEHRRVRERVGKDLRELSANYAVGKVGPKILKATREIVQVPTRHQDDPL